MKENDGKGPGVKATGVIDDFGLSNSDNLVIAVSSSSALNDDAPVIADHQYSGLGNETTRVELAGAVDAGKTVDMARSNEQTELMPQLLETSEQKGSTENVNFKMRKSLSWDRAFFTSDGVLDAEELSSMIEGSEKDVKHQLQGIEDELCRSMDSISALESDNLALESLEAKLFEDINASTQKSSRTSNLTNSSIKLSSEDRDSQPKASTSSKEADLASEKQPATRTRDSTSSTLDSSEIDRKVNPTSTITSERDSLSGNHVKNDHGISKRAPVSQKGTQAAMTQASKVTGVIGPRRAVPTTSLYSKLSSLGSSTPIKTEPTRSSPLCGGPGSSSGNNVKSSATLARRNTGSKTGQATAGSTSKTPSGISMKNKVPPANSRLQSHLVLSNHSPSTSRASSISQWSSESSSSTSAASGSSISRGSRGTNVPHRSFGNNVKSSATVARRKDDSKTGKPSAGSIPITPSRISLKNIPPPVNSNSSRTISLTSSISERLSESSSSTSAKSTLKNHPTGWNSDRNGKQLAALPSQTGSLSCPPSALSAGRGTPSPKIGLFDGGKSGTPNEGIRNQSRLSAGLLKTGATHGSRTGSSNGAKTRKLPQLKTIAAHTGLKPNSRKSTTRKPSRKQSSAKAKPSSSASRGAKKLLVVSPEVWDIKGKINALKIEISLQKKDSFKEIKMAPAESGISESSSNICINSSHHVGDDTNRQSSKINKKENGQVPKKEKTYDKTITGNSRTPFAVKKAVYDAKETDKSRGYAN